MLIGFFYVTVFPSFSVDPNLAGAAALESLSFAKDMKNLSVLDISDTDITDISPLAGKPIKTLCIEGYLYNTAKNMFPDATIIVK